MSFPLIKTPMCPICDGPPIMLLGGNPPTQAFCGNDDCRVFLWNPTLGPEQVETATVLDEPDFDTAGEESPKV